MGPVLPYRPHWRSRELSCPRSYSESGDCFMTAPPPLRSVLLRRTSSVSPNRSASVDETRPFVTDLLRSQCAAIRAPPMPVQRHMIIMFRRSAHPAPCVSHVCSSPPVPVARLKPKAPGCCLRNRFPKRAQWVVTGL